MTLSQIKTKTQVITTTALQEMIRKNTKIPIQINWNELIEFQVKCLKSGPRGVGIPYLIIAQNATQNHLPVYSIDKH